MTGFTILTGDCRQTLAQLPDGSVHTCITSPPYWGLRAYLPDGHESKALELGAEPSPDEYVANLVAVFREVRRVLRPDGTLWCILGDSYANPGKGGAWDEGRQRGKHSRSIYTRQANRGEMPGLKPKDLVGIPWRVALALQADGWWLRSDIIYAKSNPMPESVTDRPTRAHEYLFLLTKSARYYYDAAAIAEPSVYAADAPSQSWQRDGGKMLNVAHPNGKLPSHRVNREPTGIKFGGNKHPGNNDNRTYSGNEYEATATRNKRSVWTLSTANFCEAHFATFPPALVEPCILAGTSAHGCCPACGAPWKRNEAAWQPTCKCDRADVVPCTVLDPFTGSGTTGAVALSLGRQFVGCELYPEYVAMAERRIVAAPRPLFGL